NARSADSFEGSLDVQGVLPDQHSRKGPDQGHVSLRRVRGLALSPNPLVGINANVHLVSVHGDFRRSQFGDFQLWAVIWRSGGLGSRGNARQTKHSSQGENRTFQ